MKYTQLSIGKVKIGAFVVYSPTSKLVLKVVKKENVRGGVLLHLKETSKPYVAVGGKHGIGRPTNGKVWTSAA